MQGDSNHAAKAVVKSLRRSQVSFRGEPLTAHDFAIFREALAAQGALLSDITPPVWDARRRWMSFLTHPIDVQTFSDTIKLADSILKLSVSRFCENTEAIVGSVRDFKRRVRHEGLYWSFLSPIEPWIEEWFNTSSVQAFTYCIQWINLLSHLRLVDVDLKTDLMEEYRELESVETNWEYDPSLIQQLNQIMREWLNGLEFEDPRPSNGPGAAAETHRAQNRTWKYASFATDTRLEYFLRRVYPSGERYLLTDKLPYTLTRVSEIVCVPKSMTKNRTISKEPAILQYYQHAIWEQLHRWIRKNPSTRAIIDLERQDLSRDLAQRGSIDGSYATIDLSSASDTVTLRLAKGLFAGTSLYLPEICLRSDRTRLPNGEVIRLNKLAPMGSDLCFPTECLVFASVCELAVRVTCGHASRKNDYRVYGDDIVIRQPFASKLVSLLGDLHFKVNETKSFVDLDLHYFREACGGEFLDGIPTSPTRLSRKWTVSLDTQNRPCLSSVEEVSSWVELSNELYSSGYLSLRRWILHRLATLFPRYAELPYTNRDKVEDPNHWLTSIGRSPSTSSTTIRTFDWCCTNFRLPYRRNGVFGADGQGAVYALVARGIPSRQSPCAPSIDPEEVRWLEYWTRVASPRKEDTTGVIYAPEAIRSIDPLRLVWRKKWITT